MVWYLPGRDFRGVFASPSVVILVLAASPRVTPVV